MSWFARLLTIHFFPQDTSCDETLTNAQQQAQPESAGLSGLAAVTRSLQHVIVHPVIATVPPDCRDFGVQPEARRVMITARAAVMASILIAYDQNGKACEALPIIN